AGLGDDADLGSCVAALRSAHSQGASLTAEVSSLRESVRALTAAMSRRDAESSVARVIAEGRATPAEQAVLISVREKLGEEGFCAMMAARPVLNLSGGVVPATQPPTVDQLSDAAVVSHARTLMASNPSLSLSAATREAERALTAGAGQGAAQ
ncbi:MAG: hypothetical protein EAZ99_03965, partial [Alphaproteobacteria bacterium]